MQVGDRIKLDAQSVATLCNTCTRTIREYELHYICARCGKPLCSSCSLRSTQCRGCTPGEKEEVCPECGAILWGTTKQGYGIGGHMDDCHVPDTLSRRTHAERYGCHDSTPPTTGQGGCDD